MAHAHGLPHNLAVGDYFKYVGPDGRGGVWRRSGWRPRAWTSHPEDPASQPIRAEDFHINFANSFRIEELVVGPHFVTARVTARGRNAIWLNISKHGTSWVRAVNGPRESRSRSPPP